MKKQVIKLALAGCKTEDDVSKVIEFFRPMFASHHPIGSAITMTLYEMEALENLQTKNKSS